VCRGPENLHNYASGLKLKREEGGGGILPNMAVNFIGLSLFGANCCWAHFKTHLWYLNYRGDTLEFFRGAVASCLSIKFRHVSNFKIDWLTSKAEKSVWLLD
jgi:hypothetical protein